jgi:hypothetical protein
MSMSINPSNPSREAFREMFRLYFDKAKEEGKPFVEGKTVLSDEDGTIFSFPSEEDDPINGMHEFPYDLFAEDEPEERKRCIHCGKTKKELL